MNEEMKQAHIHKDEEDFEMVHTYTQDTDDLSSITGTASETDTDCDCEIGYIESADSPSVTLQMPDLSTDSIVTEKAHASSDADEDICGDEIATIFHAFDLKPRESVELPIFYSGPETMKEKVMAKIASAFIREFSSDVWTSDTFCVLPAAGSDEGKANIRKRSRIAIKVLTDLKQLGEEKHPFMVIQVEDEALNASRDDFRAVTIASALRRGAAGIILYPSDPIMWDPSPSFCYVSANNKITSMVPGGFYCEPEHVTSIELSIFLEETGEVLSESIMSTLDKWHELQLEWPSVIKQRDQTAGRSEIARVLMILGFFLLSALMIRTISWYVTKSPAELKFFQVTDTVTLIELPSEYRRYTPVTVPAINVSVTRDGKPIDTWLRLSTNNLYVLDWSPNDAYGELLVAAQLVTERYNLNKAIVVEYTSRKSFTDTMAEKFRELDHSIKGIAAGIDLDNRLNTISKQIEEQRSYAIQTYHSQVDLIKHQGSQGLKKLQKEYLPALHKTTKQMQNIVESSSKWSQTARKSFERTTKKQVRQASRGLRILQRKLKRLQRR